MAKCNFCRNVIESGTGTMFIKNDGTIFNFCSMKCKKNLMKLKRDASKLKWTKAYKKQKGGKK